MVSFTVYSVLSEGQQNIVHDAVTLYISEEPEVAVA